MYTSFIKIQKWHSVKQLYPTKHTLEKREEGVHHLDKIHSQEYFDSKMDYGKTQIK